MSKTIYFKGLTELRAIAAIAVIFHHIELYKLRQLEPSLMSFSKVQPFMERLGKNGVFLFFVLSGFLITYLLLKERSESGTIAIKKFYARRLLRIWPLYYIIVGLSFIIVPLTLNHQFWASETYYLGLISKIEYGGNLALFLFLLSNVALVIYPPVVGASQSWSVSVEEQFYLFWPILMKLFYKNIFWVLLIIAILKPLTLSLLAIMIGSSMPILNTCLQILEGLKIEYMAMGGLLAYFFITEQSLVNNFFSSKKHFRFLVFIILILLIVNPYSYLNALSFTFLIGFVIHHGLESQFLKKVGEVSYGIYMYHPIIMYLSFAMVHNLFPNFKSFPALLIEYILVFSLSYLVSVLSYKYIETRFLKLKSKFTIIHSKNI